MYINLMVFDLWDDHLVIFSFHIFVVHISQEPIGWTQMNDEGIILSKRGRVLRCFALQSVYPYLLIDRPPLCRSVRVVCFAGVDRFCGDVRHLT